MVQANSSLSDDCGSEPVNCSGIGFGEKPGKKNLTLFKCKKDRDHRKHKFQQTVNNFQVSGTVDILFQVNVFGCLLLGAGCFGAAMRCE